MKQINITPLEGVSTTILQNAINNVPQGKYALYVNLKNGNVNIAKSARPKRSELVIGKVILNDCSNEKSLEEFFQNVHRTIRKYHSSGVLMCRTTVIRQFGQKFVDRFDPVFIVENPHYKCASPMCLYDINTLKYNKANIA